MGLSTMQKGIYYLKGIVKHYDWGGFNFIPSLLKQENTGERPFAEYWMGVHPLGSSLVEINGQEKRLADLKPGIPFLFKVLDVKDMLSIQVHPTKQGAVEGYEAENNLGIPADAPYRNYKDKNHKPELMIALSDFWLLHGFKPEKELVYTLLNVVELRELLPVFNEGSYKGLYKHVMEMPQKDVNRILDPLIKNISEVYKENEADKDDEDFWVARAAKLFCPAGHIDRGIFSIFFMNLLHLKNGDAIFQDAGVPHAYLEGQNIEVMANSDNVLRGGLTTKHIAVDELIRHIKWQPTFPEILKPVSQGEHEQVFNIPVKDFRLSLFNVEPGDTVEYKAGDVEFLFIVNGSTTLDDGVEKLQLVAGHPSVVIFPQTSVRIKAMEKSLIFRSTIPAN
jgi:mannose-6-phosphate isomerase